MLGDATVLFLLFLVLLAFVFVAFVCAGINVPRWALCVRPIKRFLCLDHVEGLGHEYVIV